MLKKSEMQEGKYYVGLIDWYEKPRKGFIYTVWNGKQETVGPWTDGENCKYAIAGFVKQ